MRQFFTVLILCLLWINSTAQTFQRNYTLSNFEEQLNIAGTQTSDDGFATLDGITIDSTLRNILITKYDLKGTILWSRQIFFSDGDSIRTSRIAGDLFQGSNDSLYYTFTIFKEDGPNKFIGAMDVQGLIGWGKVVNDNSTMDYTDLSWNVMEDYVDSTFIQTSNVGSSDDNTTLLNHVGYDGTLLNSIQIEATLKGDAVDVFPDDIEIKKDSTIMLAGTLEVGSYFLNVYDQDLNPTLSMTYGDTLDFLTSYRGIHVAETPDTGYILVGSFEKEDTQSPPLSGSFISKHDSLGAIIWAKYINFDTMEVPDLHGVIVKEDGTIMIAGRAQNDFLSQLDDEGNIEWTRLYGSIPVLSGNGDNFESTSDNGYMIISSVSSDGDTLMVVNIIKTDTDGSSSCEDTIFQDTFEDLSIESISYDVESIVRDDVSLDDYDYRADVFSSFAVVDPMLESMIFCPNEPINFLLDASVDGGVAYEWNTGATTDTLRIFDDEQYTVTVTVGEKVCFMLCDTIAMERFELPSVSGTYQCNQGSYDLFIFPVAQAGVDSIVWSTGAMNVESINVTEQGTYSVTVVDNCGEAAVTTIDVDPPLPTFTPIFACREEGIFLLSEFNPGQTLDIQWSTGAQDDGKHEVLITDKTQYTVTLTDVCNETVSAVVNVDPPTPNVSIDGECRPEGIFLNVNVSNNTGILDINWSTGSQDDGMETIEIPAIGEYMVTVTDLCREVASATEDFNPTPVQVVLDYSCDSDGFTINASPVTSILNTMWSTGSQDDGQTSIFVTQSGDYNVTITDNCRLTSSGSINIPVLPDMLSITPEFSTACDNGPVSLTASANGSVTYLWDDGTQGAVLSTMEIGTFTVVATDECGNELTESITFDEGDLPIEVTDLTITLDAANFCETNMVTLTAGVLGQTTGIEWSTGETTGSISVPVDNQTITLTAFDECGNEEEEIVVDFNPGDAISFPKIFFPEENDLQDPNNRLFGAFTTQVSGMDTLDFDEVYASIVNYELHVFNRWGQEVFVSNNVLDRWNGRLEDGNEIALPDVYVWYATWEDTAGCTYDSKGDVTLFR